MTDKLPHTNFRTVLVGCDPIAQHHPDARRRGQAPAHRRAAMLLEQLPIADLELCRQLANLIGEQSQQRPQPRRHRRVIDQRQYLPQVLRSLWRYQPKLGKLAANSIRQRRPLSNQQLAYPMRGLRRLLLGRLNRYEPHLRPRQRLADRRRIRRIRLVPPHIGLDVLRRYQPHIVAQGPKLPPPMMRRRAGLDPYQTASQPAEEAQNLAPLQTPPQNSPAAGIRSVHLKNRLRHVQTYRANLFHGWLP